MNNDQKFERLITDSDISEEDARALREFRQMLLANVDANEEAKAQDKQTLME